MCKRRDQGRARGRGEAGGRKGRGGVGGPSRAPALTADVREGRQAVAQQLHVPSGGIHAAVGVGATPPAALRSQQSRAGGTLTLLRPGAGHQTPLLGDGASCKSEPGFQRAERLRDNRGSEPRRPPPSRGPWGHGDGASAPVGVPGPGIRPAGASRSQDGRGEHTHRCPPEPHTRRGSLTVACTPIPKARPGVQLRARSRPVRRPPARPPARFPGRSCTGRTRAGTSGRKVSSEERGVAGRGGAGAEGKGRGQG